MSKNICQEKKVVLGMRDYVKYIGIPQSTCKYLFNERRFWDFISIRHLVNKNVLSSCCL